MIDCTVLLCTFVADLCLAAGYGLARWEEFLASSRLAVLGLLEVLR